VHNFPSTPLLIHLHFVQSSNTLFLFHSVFVYFTLCFIIWLFDRCVTERAAIITTTPPISTSLETSTSTSYADTSTTQPTSETSTSTVAGKLLHSAGIFVGRCLSPYMAVACTVWKELLNVFPLFSLYTTTLLLLLMLRLLLQPFYGHYWTASVSRYPQLITREFCQVIRLLSRKNYCLQSVADGK